jgi:Condensation domain
MMTMANHSTVPVPLSVSEERMLQRLEQWGPNAWGRNLYLAYRLTGPLDESALRAALDELTRGQEGLRSIVKGGAGTWGKELRDPSSVEFDFEIEDTPDASIEEISDRIIEQVARPLSPETGHVARGKLYRVAPEDRVLVLVFHHVVFDASCYGVLVRELNALYGAACNGTLGSYRHPALTATDFAKWQRQLLDSPRYDELSAYWKGFWPKVTPLKDAVPVDTPRGSGVRRRTLLPFDVSPELMAKVRAATNASRVTLPTFCCAAATILMSRLAGVDDVTIGYVHSLRGEYSLRNRHQKETLERVLGTFVAPLPVRVAFGASTTGVEVLAEVHRGLRDGFMHFDLPALDFLGEPGKKPAHQAIFPVIFNYHRTRSQLSLAGVTAERMRRDLIERPTRWAPQNELEWRIVESGGPVHGILVYDGVLWTEESAKRMADSYVKVLEDLATRGSAALRSL